MEETKIVEPQLAQEPPQMITETKTSGSFSSKKVSIVIGVILVIFIAAGSYTLLHRSTRTQSTGTTQALPTQKNEPTSLTKQTPVISPVTSSTVDQTLNNTDTTMQNSINQANTDLNQINSVDTSQDNTNGL